jgi:hypothetical protein
MNHFKNSYRTRTQMTLLEGPIVHGDVEDRDLVLERTGRLHGFWIPSAKLHTQIGRMNQEIRKREGQPKPMTIRQLRSVIPPTEVEYRSDDVCPAGFGKRCVCLGGPGPRRGKSYALSIERYFGRVCITGNQLRDGPDRPGIHEFPFRFEEPPLPLTRLLEIAMGEGHEGDQGSTGSSRYSTGTSSVSSSDEDDEDGEKEADASSPKSALLMPPPPPPPQDRAQSSASLASVLEPTPETEKPMDQSTPLFGASAAETPPLTGGEDDSDL